jgi:SAM-dependent methyltransferase
MTAQSPTNQPANATPADATQTAPSPAASANAVHEAVRLHYAEAALSVSSGESCCRDTGDYGGGLYSTLEREELPDAAVMASLGCGNPVAVADLHEGERVLDLGSGGGIDVLLSAKRVGPTGRAFGLDMTDEMLALAQRNAVTAGATNVEWLKGHIEAIPLPAASVDVVISNCVVNLAADKPAVFREMARVLVPGGRIGITDIVADDSLSPERRAELGSYTACIAGALTFSEFRTGLEAEGFHDVSLTVSHPVAEKMYSVIVKATRNSDAAIDGGPAGVSATSSTPTQTGGCCG